MNTKPTTEETSMAARELSGVVVRKSGDKSVMVEVVREMAHPAYGKTIKTTKRYMAHDANNEAQVGDAVLLAPTRPMSAKKRWKIVKSTEA